MTVPKIRRCGNCGWGYIRPGFEVVWCDWMDQVMLPKLKMKFDDLPESVDKIMLSANDATKCKCWTPRKRKEGA
jgi:hypothetical protein